MREEALLVHEKPVVNVFLEDLLRVNRMGLPEGVPLELVVNSEIPIAITFKGNFKLSSHKDLVISSGGLTHLNPMDEVGKEIPFEVINEFSKNLMINFPSPSEKLTLTPESAGELIDKMMKELQVLKDFYDNYHSHGDCLECQV